jgi:hypothetical protein
MRAAVLLPLLAFAGCADVLGIEDAHLGDSDSTLPDSGALPGASGTGSGGTDQNGSSDEDHVSQGSAGSEGSDGGAGAASPPGEPPDDPEPELPPSNSNGGVAGSTTSGGTPGNGGAGGSSGGSGGTGSGGASSGGSSGGSGGSAGSEEPPSLNCQSYCSSVLANCTGQYAQYRNENECLAVCALLPLGAPLAVSGNSVACRQTEATLAALAPAAHCKNAGPAGNARCGETCEGYCSIVLSTCKAPEKHSFPSLAKCSETCLGRTDLANYGVDPKLGYDSGPTQQCLLAHATAATASTKECESAIGGEKCRASEDDD